MNATRLSFACFCTWTAWSGRRMRCCTSARPRPPSMVCSELGAEAIVADIFVPAWVLAIASRWAVCGDHDAYRPRLDSPGARRLTSGAWRQDRRCAGLQSGLVAPLADPAPGWVRRCRRTLRVVRSALWVAPTPV